MLKQIMPQKAQPGRAGSKRTNHGWQVQTNAKCEERSQEAKSFNHRWTQMDTDFGEKLKHSIVEIGAVPLRAGCCIADIQVGNVLQTT
jgi:hypothetical protein